MKKTILLLDEKNYLVYINHRLLKEKGNKYQKEKKYLKAFVKKLWETNFQEPETLKSAEKIDILKEVFELENLEII